MPDRDVRPSVEPNIAWVSVGVESMEPVRRLWVEQLGFEVLTEHAGPDAELGALWGIEEGAISEQLLLQTPGATTGRLHFVEFHEPAEAARAGAASTDLGPKNLDVYCQAIADRVSELQAAGHRFRSAVSEYEIDGILAREVQMPAHDALNLVLIEAAGKGFDMQFSSQGYAGLTSFVVIVPDVSAEAVFYREMFGMHEVLTHKLSGPAIETAAALPSGTVLDLHLLGAPDNVFGRMELIQYVGVEGDDRFARARAPATGILQCGFRVPDLEAFCGELDARGIEAELLGERTLLPAAGDMCSLSSPAGLQLLVAQAAE